MMTTFRWGPEYTPKTVQKLIFITCAIAILAALTEPVFTQIFGFPGLQGWLSLSWYGIEHYLLWQPFTYIFLQSGGGQGISFSFLISLTFDMYLLWILGTELLNAVGEKSFLQFYFLSTLMAALAALLMMYISKQFVVVATPVPPLLAIFTAWSLLNPEADLLLFFLFPIRVKWLFAGVVAAIFLVNLSQLNWVFLGLYTGAILFGYLYATLVWGFEGFWPRFTKKQQGGPKIFDINTGKPVQSDEEFIDAMLAKISRKGEGSLTRSERQRMKEISEKRSKK